MRNIVMEGKYGANIITDLIICMLDVQLSLISSLYSWDKA